MRCNVCAICNVNKTELDDCNELSVSFSLSLQLKCLLKQDKLRIK